MDYFGPIFTICKTLRDSYQDWPRNSWKIYSKIIIWTKPCMKLMPLSRSKFETNLDKKFLRMASKLISLWEWLMRWSRVKFSKQTRILTNLLLKIVRPRHKLKTRLLLYHLLAMEQRSTSSHRTYWHLHQKQISLPKMANSSYQSSRMPKIAVFLIWCTTISRQEPLTLKRKISNGKNMLLLAKLI